VVVSDGVCSILVEILAVHKQMVQAFKSHAADQQFEVFLQDAPSNRLLCGSIQQSWTELILPFHVHVDNPNYLFLLLGFQVGLGSFHRHKEKY